MDAYGKALSQRYGALAAACLLSSIFTCWAPASLAAGPQLRLRPVEVEAGKDSLRATLVNDGTLAVHAFCMTSQSGSVEITEDLPPRPPLVPVGGVKVVTLSTQPAPADGAAAEARSFAVTCVQWEDGSVEGRPGDVAMLLQGEAGEAYEWKRLSTVFERVERCTDADWNAALSAAAQWIAANGATLDDGARAEGDFAGGMRTANLAARMTLDSLRRLSVDPAGMATARQHLADMTSRWHATRDFLGRVKGLPAYTPAPRQPSR